MSELQFKILKQDLIDFGFTKNGNGDFYVSSKNRRIVAIVYDGWYVFKLFIDGMEVWSTDNGKRLFPLRLNKDELKTLHSILNDELGGVRVNPYANI